MTEAMWDVADYNILLKQAEIFKAQLSLQTGKGKNNVLKCKLFCLFSMEPQDACFTRCTIGAQ